MSKRVCNTCHSEDIVFDAWAEWDGEKYVLSDVFDEVFCRQCDGQTKYIEINEINN